VSWSVYLNCDCCGSSLVDQNGTHNVNPMANAVLADNDMDNEGTWWKQLDGMGGPDGAHFLDVIIKGMEADPPRFRAMNPPNGWGDYDGFLDMLRKMRARVPECHSTWSASG
jgi:hypothetical protein